MENITLEKKELVNYGNFLNSLHESSDTTFEPEVDNPIKECSLNEVIQSFQNFSMKKNQKFKVWINRNSSLNE